MSIGNVFVYLSRIVPSPNVSAEFRRNESLKIFEFL